MTRENKKTYDFGYKAVTEEEKTENVGIVFDSVAEKYDLMNDLMSLGLHRFWKKFTMLHTGLDKGMSALDVAGGTGDLAANLYQQVGEKGLVVLTDINFNMLKKGRSKLMDQGKLNNIQMVQANAELLPFPDNMFDCVSIGFGLRNVTHKNKTLTSIFKSIKPGGRLLILEFSKPNELISPFYDFYSFNILPKLGEWVVNDAGSYQYLAESIRMHPDQESLKDMMQMAGYANCEYFNLSGGIVALHIGHKI